MAKSAVAAARAVVRARFGDDYLPVKPRTYRPRARRADTLRHATERMRRSGRPGSQRAPEDVEGRLDRASARLYGLVWRRALASQMATARVDRVRIGLAPAAGAIVGDILLGAEGADPAFDGHRRAWRGDGEGDDREDGVGGALPGLAEGEPVTVTAARAVRPCHRAAAALHEAGVGAPAGGDRHRAAVDLGGDHRCAAAARLRDPPRPAFPGPDRDRIPEGVLRPVGGWVA